jgi:hypothetical protein
MYPQKLKLGLLLDTYQVPAWAYRVVQRILAGNYAEFSLVILNADGNKQESIPGNAWVYSQFDKIDQKFFGKEPNPLDVKSVAELLANAPTVKAQLLRTQDVVSFHSADVLKIKEYKLDVLVKIGFDALQSENLAVSKYGTWFYYFGDDRKIKGGPAGFWESVENWPETGAVLRAVGGDMALDQALYRSDFFTYALSPARHRSYYFWAAAPFLPRQLERLQRLGAEKFFQSIEKFNLPTTLESKQYETPPNFLASKLALGILFNLGKEFFRRFFYFDQWILLFSLQKDSDDHFGAFHKLTPPKDKFWADPQILSVGGKYYIFIEEFSSAKGKGHLSVIEMDEHGNASDPVIILDKNYHLSYPFVFEWGGKFYMVPETAGNHTIDLYECVDFPYQWRFKQTLMENIWAVDTTLIYHAQKWWLFTAIAENEAAAPNVELFLFYADDLFTGHWTAHPQNPIVSDVKNARPAGAIFEKDGKLLRPSQDCSKMYGYGFDLNEIQILSESEYREQKVTSVRPTWDKTILATHTFARQGNLTVIDAFRCKRKIF